MDTCTHFRTAQPVMPSSKADQSGILPEHGPIQDSRSWERRLWTRRATAHYAPQSALKIGQHSSGDQDMIEHPALAIVQ